MGKKSRRNRKPGSLNSASATAAPAPGPLSSTGVDDGASNEYNRPLYYTSDGPSDVELLQTTSASLQLKLNRLTELGLANDRAGFVRNFVPLDLSPEDAAGYLQDLTTAPEAEGQWTNLIAEIAAIRSGLGVNRIEGDQVTRANFFFSHPLLEKCDREVSFVFVNGDWRADG